MLKLHAERSRLRRLILIAVSSSRGSFDLSVKRAGPNLAIAFNKLVCHYSAGDIDDYYAEFAVTSPEVAKTITSTTHSGKARLSRPKSVTWNGKPAKGGHPSQYSHSSTWLNFVNVTNAVTTTANKPQTESRFCAVALML